jgi:hypothetical protein
MACALNGPCHKLREERLKKGEFKKLVRRSGFITVDIDRITHTLKGEKRYAYRKDDMKKSGLQRNTEKVK